MTDDPLYSVVIPVYRSEATVGETVRQVRDFFESTERRLELLLINDGSPDRSWEIISQLANEHDNVVAIDLLRNYGQHSANMCGFRHATGDWIITMDDDLQNPPSQIEHLIAATRSGHDLVLGQFEDKKHSSVRRIGSRVVGWLNRRVFNVEPDLVLSNFRIIRRDVIERVIKIRSTSPYIPGLLLKYSKRRRNVMVRHDERLDGTSTYTPRRLLRLVATVMFNHSTIPLRWAAGFGFFTAAVSFALGLYYLVAALVGGTRQPGWPTLVVLLSFFNGILIVLVSVIGEYVIRVLRDQRVESSYEISEVVGR